MMSRALILLLACLTLVVSAKLNAPFTGKYEDLPLISSAQIVGGGFNAKTAQSGLTPVLSWTFNYNTTWQSPLGTVYKVPDQLMLAENSYSSTKVCLVLSTDFQAYFHTFFSWDVFYGIIPLPGAFLAFGRASEVGQAELKIAGGDTFYSWSSYNTMYYSLDMAPAYMLTPSSMLRLSIEGLPESYSAPSDLQKYQEFVTAYGTHYVCFADMGGSMHMSSYISKAIADQFGLTVTAQQMAYFFAISFFSLFNAGFKTKSDITLASWFQANATFNTYFYGGNADYQSNVTLAEWIASIPETPAMLNKTLCPLSMLISDQTKRASLESYIGVYVNGP